MNTPEKNPSIVIIGTVWPEPNSSAAGSRMLQLIELFQEMNFAITFASAAAFSEYAFNLAEINVETCQILLNSDSFDEFITLKNPAIVLFDRYMTEEQYGWRVSENCPNALRILDTEDLHCLRIARQKAFKSDIEFKPNQLFNEPIAFREIASILRCDLSLMVSDFEIEVLKNQFKIDESLLFYIPLMIKDSDIPSSSEFKNFEQRTDFMFIGNFLHEPNWNAVLYLKNVIWNKIRKEIPTARLNIYGAYVSDKVLNLHQPQNGFHIIGRAENAQLAIENARVMLAPLQFGAGIKGKLLEAMQYGTPSITNSIGAEAMNDNLPWNGYIEDNPEVFISKAVNLYKDMESWNQSQENGIQIIKKRFLKSKFEKGFKEKMHYLTQNILEHRSQNFYGKLLHHHQFQGTKYMSLWITAKNNKV